MHTPTDLAEGVYSIRTGIYIPGTDLRLQVHFAPQAGAGYAVIGQIDVVCSP